MPASIIFVERDDEPSETGPSTATGTGRPFVNVGRVLIATATSLPSVSVVMLL